MRLVSQAVRNNQADVDQYGSDPTQNISLTAVISDDPENPNHVYSKYTPHAELNASITNESVFGFFEEGVEYDVLITKRT